MLGLGFLKSLFGIYKLDELDVLEVCGRTRLIDKVDGLIGKVSVSDISLRSFYGKLYDFVRVSYVVMLLVVISNAFQDLY